MSAENAAAVDAPAKTGPLDYLAVAALAAICIAGGIWLLYPGAWPERIIPSVPIRAALVAVAALGLGAVISRRLAALADWGLSDGHLTSLEEYQACGVGPLPADSSPESMYLDLVKRAAMNLIYEDRPIIFYDHQKEPMPADRYRLDRRIMGEDSPVEAHTMVGLQRLNNLQECVERVLSEKVPGDLLEAGVLRGGASIFLRAVLKAHHCTDRRVFACDTFRSRQVPKPSLLFDLVLSFLGLLAWIPSPGLHRAVMRTLHRQIKSEQRSFPLTDNPSPELIKLMMFQVRFAKQALNIKKDQTGLAAVQSHFAAYGLLDEQVLFLEGFFSDTLPTAPIEQLAVIRLDGDLYESTMDVLKPLYPKLSRGGYCIVDDYHAFSDCRRAIDEYRAEHNITDEIHPIDHLAVYWRKS